MRHAFADDELRLTRDRLLIRSAELRDRVQRVRRALPPPAGVMSPVDDAAFVAIERTIRKHYDAPVVPTMSTGATDMAFLRAKGIRCFGIGPATDQEDGPLGYGAHSDQERILESELYRFVRFHYDLVATLAGAG